MITVITPINDITWLDNCINNFEQQDFKYKELVLILNGDLINENLEISKRYNCLVYDQEPNMGKIRNVGLDWMERNNREVFSFLDSDDEYGPEYLTEAFEALEQNPNKLVGKMNFRFKSGLHDSDKYEMVGLEGVNSTIQGPTITGYVTKERFKPLVTAEDIEFVQRHEVKITSINNFVYNVRSDSIQKRNFTQFLEFFKSYHTIFNNEKFKILKNSEIFWEYGMEHDPMDFWKESFKTRQNGN